MTLHAATRDNALDATGHARDLALRLDDAGRCGDTDEVCAAADAAFAWLSASDADRLAPSAVAAYLEIALPTWMESRFVHRARTKPRGYAGDYLTMQWMYDQRAVTESPVGAALDEWVMSAPGSSALLARRGVLAELIGSAPSGSVMTIGSGPAAEIFDVARTGSELRAVCVDFDAASLGFVRRRARSMGCLSSFEFRSVDVRRLITGRASIGAAPRPLVYSVGLADYLTDNALAGLVRWMAEQTVPGGRIVVGNLSTSFAGRHFLEHVLDWPLIYRNPDDLTRVFAASGVGFDAVDVRADGSGGQLFAVGTVMCAV